MEHHTQYYAIEASTLGELTNKANDLMKSGWTPLGPPSVVATGYRQTYLYLQAFTK